MRILGLGALALGLLASSSALALNAGPNQAMDGLQVVQNCGSMSPYGQIGGGTAVRSLGGVLTVDTNGNLCTNASGGPSGVSATLTNPTSSYQLASSTSAYTAGQLMANSGTAGSVTVPSFAILNAAGGAYVTRLRLYINDGVSTGFGAMQIQVDLWTAAPTWTNGDHAAWAPATNLNAHVAAFTCTTSGVFGTTGLNSGGSLGNGGVFAECSPKVGTFAAPVLGSGTSIFWSLDAVTGSGVITTGGATVVLTAELSN
jgi:hypothetical protein